jgi:hypothetical protein
MQQNANGIKIKLHDARGLLEELFDEGSRPSLRWLRDQQKARAIPYIKCGRLVFFDPEAVRAALQKRTVGKVAR